MLIMFDAINTVFSSEFAFVVYDLCCCTAIIFFTHSQSSSQLLVPTECTQRSTVNQSTPSLDCVSARRVHRPLTHRRTCQTQAFLLNCKTFVKPAPTRKQKRSRNWKYSLQYCLFTSVWSICIVILNTD